MKKIILVLILLLGYFFSHGQLELKGYMLGKIYRGDEIVMTTLGGVEGALLMETINDGRLFSISFYPSDDGETIRWITFTEVETLTKGIENKYDIKFRKILQDDYSEDYWKSAKKGDVEFLISVEHNEFMDYPYQFGLSIYNNILYEISVKEKQAEANKDF